MTDKNPEESKSQKWALLIGINRYRHAKTSGFPDLNGCVNDVADMRALLIGKFGFPSSQVAVLKDEQATRAGILEALRSSLIEKAQVGDIAVLYYSGHGSEAFDPERINERDQTIVPHDGRDPAGEIADISGNDLNHTLAELKTANGTFIFDSCHSGTIRARRTGKIRSIPMDPRIPMPQVRTRTAQPLLPAGLRPPSANYALVAACAADELSVEAQMDGIDRGLLTYFLCRELRRSTHPLTYRDLMDYLLGMIVTVQPDQHPRIEGAGANSYVFGDTAVIARPYVLVSPQTRDEVTFDGGRELGMTVGSTYAVYGPGAKQFAPPESVTATVEVTRVDDFGTDGRIVSGGPVVANSRAVELTHRYEAAVLQIKIDEAEPSETLRTIREKLSDLPYARLTDAPQNYTLRVWNENGSIRVEPNLGSSVATTFSSGTAAVDEVLRQITQWTCWMNLLTLNNPSSQLDLDFTIAPLSGDRSGYFDDGMVECTIKNNSESDLYLSILDFADDGSIHVIFPVDDPSLLYAGCSLRKSFELGSLPSHRNTGWDTLKLIVSTIQRDFRIFETESIRSSSLGEDPFSQMLLAIASGRAKDTVQFVASGDWTTRERSFTYSSTKALSPNS